MATNICCCICFGNKWCILKTYEKESKNNIVDIKVEAMISINIPKSHVNNEIKRITERVPLDVNFCISL